MSIQATEDIIWLNERKVLFIYKETEIYTCAGGCLPHTHSHLQQQLK